MWSQNTFFACGCPLSGSIVLWWQLVSKYETRTLHLFLCYQNREWRFNYLKPFLVYFNHKKKEPPPPFLTLNRIKWWKCSSSDSLLWLFSQLCSHTSSIFKLQTNYPLNLIPISIHFPPVIKPISPWSVALRFWGFWLDDTLRCTLERHDGHRSVQYHLCTGVHTD